MPTPSDLPFQLHLRLLEDALDGIIIVDQNSIIHYINRSMEVLSGYTRDELHGSSLDRLIAPDGLAPHSRKIAAFIVNQHPSAILGKVRQLELLLRSGEACPVEMKAVDLGLCHGQRYFGAYMTDIRLRLQMEARNLDLVRQLEEQAMTDALTGLPNRRAFEREAVNALSRSARSAAPITVGIGDVDNFKNINDQYGHGVGDAILRSVAHAIASIARDTDVVARLGGEEFGLIFPNATVEQASHVAERIRRAVAASSVTVDGIGAVHVTISIGLARLFGRAGLDEALSAADQALYVAKNKGRDRVELSSS
ncbi:diguanylate cyclase [Rugamonas sp.]|uniref:sensor domain-containing diguanylate cyclase n=1 Tax=Rugamonas sp. TaxID=1926287 RepID=UPI0025D3DAFA|nr:diguanylate cyclase [Rugamonas sp.]